MKVWVLDNYLSAIFVTFMVFINAMVAAGTIFMLSNQIGFKNKIAATN